MLNVTRTQVSADDTRAVLCAVVCNRQDASPTTNESAGHVFQSRKAHEPSPCVLEVERLRGQVPSGCHRGRRDQVECVKLVELRVVANHCLQRRAVNRRRRGVC